MPNTNRIHGKNGYVQLWDSTSASQNMSGDGNDCSLTQSVTNPVSTGFQDPAEQRSGSGLADAKFSFNGWGNAAANGNLNLLPGIKGIIGLLVWGPAGSATGNIKYSACMVLDSTDVNGKLKDLITTKATFSLASGSVTTGCFP